MLSCAWSGDVTSSDVDPKSVLCGYFKAGLCRRGNKCKFSHDSDAVRKVAKINLYNDPRDNSKQLGGKAHSIWTLLCVREHGGCCAVRACY